MAATMQIQLDADSAEEIRELAAVLQRTPEETAEEIVANGIHMLRRYASYVKNAHTVSPEQGSEILRRAGNEPPLPGDELPEGYVRRT